MKIIGLTQGFCTCVDDDDYDYLIQYSWQIIQSRTDGRVYARHNFWSKKDKRPKSILMHHVILKQKSHKDVDHINGDGLDNRKQNLRFISRTQNNYNSQKRVNATSKYKGVSWRKDREKWRAVATINGANKYLGLFNNEITAAAAYDSAAVEHFGEYARFNFPISLLAVALKEREG
jgi:HNH endonuclease